MILMADTAVTTIISPFPTFQVHQIPTKYIIFLTSTTHHIDDVLGPHAHDIFSQILISNLCAQVGFQNYITSPSSNDMHTCTFPDPASLQSNFPKFIVGYDFVAIGSRLDSLN